MLQLLASDDGCNDLVCVQALWHPIQRHAPDYAGGTMMKPQCMHQILRSFSQALLLLTFARKQARRKLHTSDIVKSVSASGVAQPTEEPDEDKGTLSEREFEEALTWLKTIP